MGRDLCLQPLDIGLRRAQAPSNRVGRAGSGLERPAAGGRRAVQVARSMWRSARYGSGVTGCQQADGAVAVPAAPATPRPGCRETVTRR